MIRGVGLVETGEGEEEEMGCGRGRGGDACVLIHILASRALLRFAINKRKASKVDPVPGNLAPSIKLDDPFPDINSNLQC